MNRANTTILLFSYYLFQPAYKTPLNWLKNSLPSIIYFLLAIVLHGYKHGFSLLLLPKSFYLEMSRAQLGIFFKLSVSYYNVWMLCWRPFVWSQLLVKSDMSRENERLLINLLAMESVANYMEKAKKKQWNRESFRV